jgi:outer membrane protein TolC
MRRLPVIPVAYHQALRRPGADSENRELGAGQPTLEEVPARTVSPLTLEDVVGSVYASYPLLEAVLLDRDIAAGQEVAAWGGFDVALEGFSTSMPMGFYKNYRHGVSLKRPNFAGGYLYGGFKIGRGDFQPWYKERETDKAGEFSLGTSLPLLQNRRIDKRRLEVWRTALAREAVEPAVETLLLEFTRMAAEVYWTWVAAGRMLKAQEQLLELAQQRVRQIEERVRGGDLERIASIDNQRLIALRETKVIESRRKLELAAIKLSLFWRAPDGQPLLPSEAELPERFPSSLRLPPDGEAADVERAQSARPELQELQLMLEQVCLELRQAQNLMLPRLDAQLTASKDIGVRVSSMDKWPFELEAGLVGELPLQRRAARGKAEAANAKLAQIQVKRQFVLEKIAAEIRDTRSAMVAASERIERARTNLDLAEQSLSLAEAAFREGDTDLIVLNIYEQAVADARIVLIEATADFLVAQAAYEAALAVPPGLGSSSVNSEMIGETPEMMTGETTLRATAGSCDLVLRCENGAILLF